MPTGPPYTAPPISEGLQPGHRVSKDHVDLTLAMEQKCGYLSSHWCLISPSFLNKESGKAVTKDGTTVPRKAHEAGLYTW